VQVCHLRHHQAEVSGIPHPCPTARRLRCRVTGDCVDSRSIYAAFPEAQGELSSALLVSLAAGSFAGMISSVTSQPGDYIFSKASERKGSSLKGALDAYLRSGRFPPRSFSPTTPALQLLGARRAARGGVAGMATS